VRYGDLTLYPQAGSVVIKETKVVSVITYPRRNESDSSLINLEPSKVVCTLIVQDMADYFALKQWDRTHAEMDLYVDKYAPEAHYYKRVVLELGEERPQEGVPKTLLVSATFTALDPYLYDAVSGEVVY
jgi:hypothetical protein